MRKIIFWIMIAIVVALGAIIAIAAKQQVSPKVLIQGWFSSSSTGETRTEQNDDLHNAIQDKLNQMNNNKTTISASGELSDDDKAQVQDFLNSMVETN